MDASTLISKSHGVETHAFYEDGKCHLVRKGDDVSDFLDWTAMRRSLPLDKKSFLTPVASVPAHVQYEWLEKFGIEAWNRDHLPRIEKLLNDPDYRYLRTSEIII